MDMCINDASFDAQFTTYEAAVDAIKILAELTMDDKCRDIRNNRKILTTRSLRDRLLTKNQTVIEIVARMAADYDPAKRDLNQQLLNIFARVSLIEVFQQETVAVTHKGIDVKQTALDCATVPMVRYAMISCTGCEQYAEEVINIQLNGTDTPIFNFTSSQTVGKYHWQYRANDTKHLKDKSIKYGKATASHMSLTGDAAQKALSNSLLVSQGLAYNIIDKQWFAFRAESPGIFHGYCIDAPGGDSKFNKAKKLFDKLLDERVGQVFFDYVNW